MWDLIVSVPDHCLSFYFEFEDIWSGMVITRNDITTLASCDRHGSDSILSPQCNS